jgi:hypothetical protein
MSMPRFDVTAIGEVMLRYSVPVGERLECIGLSGATLCVD